MRNRIHQADDRDWAQVGAALRECLCAAAGLDTERVALFNPATRLFGALPELDSMATAVLMGAIEDRFGIRLYDIDAEILGSYGALLTHVTRLVSERERMAVSHAASL